MNGKIIDTEDEWIGVQVTDNNGLKHKIAVEFNGKIRGHGQDGYPDDSDKRTNTGNEMVRQARDYAKWYVHQETEHDTCPWYLNCDRIEDVKTAIASLSDEERRTHLGVLPTTRREIRQRNQSTASRSSSGWQSAKQVP